MAWPDQEAATNTVRRTLERDQTSPSGPELALRVKGRKRHLLVDTQGLVLEARVHSAKIQDWDGIKTLLKIVARDRLPRLSHLWMDTSYTGQGKGADWVKSALGWTAEIVRHPPKLAPEKVGERVGKGGGSDRPTEALFGAQEVRGSASTPVGRADLFLVGAEPQDEKDYERLAATSEAFVYVAMLRLMARRLARA